MIGKRDNKGFTLIEILVSTAIFLIIFVIIADLAILFNKNPQQVIREKQVENELDYAMEFLAQKIRTNTINYERFIDDSIDLTDAADNPTNLLYLIDANNNATFFSLDSNRLTYWDSEGNDAAVTSQDVEIDSLNFYIYPTETPWEYDFGSKMHNNNDQPRVTISITAHHVDDDTPIYLQTMVSTRVYER
jgi:prepilin-type N-terminal cleavage/methylation domain-containing protein